jgi:hypothetical protein
VTLHGLRVGEAKLDLTFFRDGERTRWDAKVLTGTIDVQAKAWQPWLVSEMALRSNASVTDV